MASTIDDVKFIGECNASGASSQKYKSGSIANVDISTTTNIDLDKLEVGYPPPGTNFGFDIDETPTAKTKTVFIAPTAGVIRKFYCILDVTGSSTDIDFDGKKNGTTVLSAAVNFVHGDANRTRKAGTLSVTTFAAGDTLSIDMAVTLSTGALGPYAYFDVQFTPEA